MTVEALAPGATLGILGGGQLGRMLAIAAARLGLNTHVYDPAAAPPAAQVAGRHTRAGFEDGEALLRFAWETDVVTFEFENVPAATAEALASNVAVRPGPRALAVAQDRVAEKTFLNDIGVATAPWAAVQGAQEIAARLAERGGGILKTRRMGYDGKGQVRLSGADPAEAARADAALGGVPAILEDTVAFEREISVIVARGLDGQVVAFDPGENHHEDGILRRTVVPAPIPRPVAQEAVLIAGRIVSALDYVGVMGVEMFQLGRRLLVNEIAPRVHNSGHWTIEACVIDQFETHVRAVCGWPLGEASRHSDAVMENLIGAQADDWRAHGAAGGLHLYGKSEARPGRKMGHVTRIAPRRG